MNQYILNVSILLFTHANICKTEIHLMALPNYKGLCEDLGVIIRPRELRYQLTVTSKNKKHEAFFHYSLFINVLLYIYKQVKNIK